MSGVTTYETYLRRQAENGQYGFTVIRSDFAIKIAEMLEQLRCRPEIIRCKDCKYYEPKDRNFSCNLFSDLGSANNDDDFCAWAEGREE